MPSRMDDIRSLLRTATSDCERLALQVHKGNIDRVMLKNVLENLRSALDYLAHDISEELARIPGGRAAPEKLYFPYGLRENHFLIGVRKNFPTLRDAKPQVFEAILEIQPFQSGENWLFDLCTLTNEAKHRNLNITVPQEVVSLRDSNACNVTGRDFEVIGCVVDGRPVDDLSVQDGRVVSHRKYGGTTEVLLGTRLNFLGKSLEVIPFLQMSIHRLGQLVDNISFQLLVKNGM